MVKKEAQKQAERKEEGQREREWESGRRVSREVCKVQRRRQMGQMGKRTKCEIKSRQYYTLYFCHITKWHFPCTHTHTETITVCASETLPSSAM